MIEISLTKQKERPTTKKENKGKIGIMSGQVNLNQTLLKELLDYNPETGVFSWAKDIGYKLKKGQKAGSLSCGYVRIKLFKKSYMAHRLAFLYMTGKWPDKEVDHINQIRDDNRWTNLREVTRTENLRNRVFSCSESGKTGVYWDKKGGKWRAQIRIDGKNKYLGSFTDLKEAVKVRESAEKLYYT